MWMRFGDVHASKSSCAIEQGMDFVGRAVQHEQRDLQFAHRVDRVEEIAGQEMQRQARMEQARHGRQTGERRLQDQPVEGMAADDLRRDGAAEGEAVEDRGEIFGRIES